MIKPQKNIADVKRMVKACASKPVDVRVNLGRNKIMNFTGVLSGVSLGESLGISLGVSLGVWIIGASVVALSKDSFPQAVKEKVGARNVRDNKSDKIVLCIFIMYLPNCVLIVPL